MKIKFLERLDPRTAASIRRKLKKLPTEQLYALETGIGMNVRTGLQEHRRSGDERALEQAELGHAELTGLLQELRERQPR